MAKQMILKDSEGKELARYDRGRGRPPVGDHVSQDDKGNITIVGVTSDQPDDMTMFREVIVGEKTFFVPRHKPVLPPVRKFTYNADTGELKDEGPKGRGRAPQGYEQIDDEKTINGVELKGHWLKTVKNEVEETVQSTESIEENEPVSVTSDDDDDEILTPEELDMIDDTVDDDEILSAEEADELEEELVTAEAMFDDDNDDAIRRIHN